MFFDMLYSLLHFDTIIIDWDLDYYYPKNITSKPLIRTYTYLYQRPSHKEQWLSTRAHSGAWTALLTKHSKDQYSIIDTTKQYLYQGLVSIFVVLSHDIHGPS